MLATVIWLWEPNHLLAVFNRLATQETTRYQSFIVPIHLVGLRCYASLRGVETLSEIAQYTATICVLLLVKSVLPNLKLTALRWTAPDSNGHLLVVSAAGLEPALPRLKV